MRVKIQSVVQFLVPPVLDLGCGKSKTPKSVGLDISAHNGVDIVGDLNNPLPFYSESFNTITANQVFEHILDLVPLIAEIHRVLKPGGKLIASTPYFRSSWASLDPTHVRQFTICSLDYFVKDTFYYNQYRFFEQAFSSRITILDHEYPQTVLRKFFSKRALRNPIAHENSFFSFLFPFQQITYILTK